jgi:protein-S-isoprenylcysteine O-methyltransferase Ste14
MSEVRPHLLRRVLVRFLGGGLLLAAVFFGTAGTLRYWQAWIYLIVLLVPVTMTGVYLMRRDPELLERRTRGREPRASQRLIISASTFVLILAYVLPGLDQRFGWSDVPVAVVLTADVVSLLAYGLFVLVMWENRYASRTIAVDAGQKVVSTGPYRYVRHPMYVAMIVMYLAGPIALGSYWAVLPALLLPVVLAARILDEERLLVEELPGYREYTAKTRFRLIPGLW